MKMVLYENAVSSMFRYTYIDPQCFGADKALNFYIVNRVILRPIGRNCAVSSDFCCKDEHCSTMGLW